VEAPTINRFVDGMKPFGNGAGHAYQSFGGGVEQVAVWACQDGCVVAALDQQGGASRFFPQFAGEAEFMEWLGRLLNGPEDQR